MKVVCKMKKSLKYKEIVKRLTLENFDTIKEEYKLNHTAMLGIIDYGLHDKDVSDDKRWILNKLKYNYQFSLVLKDSKYGIISDTHIGNEKDSPYYIKRAFILLNKAGIKKIFHTGDILDSYDERCDLTKDELIRLHYNQITRFHDIWPTNVTTYAILGNHDAKFKRLGINLYKELSKDTFIILGAGGAYVKCSNYKLFLEHEVSPSTLVPPHYNYDVILKGHSHFFKFKENRNIFRVASCSNLQPNSYSLGYYAPGFATISTTDGLVIDGYNFTKDETVHTLTLKIKD